MKPRVSIVTPTKNRLALLEQTMDSVSAQTFVHWEHLIVDDGSDDGTAEMVEARSKDDPRIRFIRRHGDKAGASICRNIGVRASRSSYILFLDSDDLLTPDCLACRVPTLDRNVDADFITFQPSYFVEVFGDHDSYRNNDLLGDDLTRFLFFETPWIISGPLWRKASLMRIGLFDETLPSWQDFELHVRAIAAGLRYMRFANVDHHIRWDNSVGRISADQRCSPRHLDAAVPVLETFERLIREGPGMSWIRQRGLCSLYFFIAECWLDLGCTDQALSMWRRPRQQGLASRLLHAGGAALLMARAVGLPVRKLTVKWIGWARMRTNAELVTPRQNS